MSKYIIAIAFLLGGIGLLKAVEYLLQHQWAGWIWLVCALIATVVGSWRLEDRSTYFDGYRDALLEQKQPPDRSKRS